jgi:acylaminoacyl-peptidase
VALADAEDRRLRNTDIFELEFALDPQIAPGGDEIAYVRQSMDIVTDRAVDSVWLVNLSGNEHRPVLSGTSSFSSPRWSPDGDRLAYVSAAGDRGAELHVRWMDTGQTALLSNLPYSPGGIAWSPNGKYLAFTMLVDDPALKLASPPSRPEGAEWAPPVTIVDRFPYRADGAGYLKTGYTHVFMIPADGGTPHQLTSGNFNHGGQLAWSPDGEQIVFSANRIDEPIDDPLESELWAVDIATGDLTQLTERDGPDASPTFSPDGSKLAYLGFDDEKMGYHNVNVYVMDVANGTTESLTDDFDRSVNVVQWHRDSKRLYVQYDDRGARRVGLLSANGRIENLIGDIGGATSGRPYTSGSFSVSKGGDIAYSAGRPERPADVGLLERGGTPRRVTALNDDLLAQREVGVVEEVTWRSSVGDYEIQGWLVKPPGFDPDEKYPFVLEIHGGPFAAYGPHFSPEIQLYAAAGYVVLYSNPRGSTSYGWDFANEIHHNYPNQDYDDLMSGVDAVIEKGFVDPEQLFVTGGSGGGVLTAWIVGNTDRFKAAVVQKPVINWGSFVLTSDGMPFFTRYWFDAMPWEDPEAYWKRSPLSLVGNVTTPTMLMTGEEDWRTPMAESEQFFQALALRKVDTALVRVPERSHNLVARPSHLIAKADNIIAWFEKYREE